MISALITMAPLVWRAIPDDAKIGLANGSLRLFGSVIRRANGSIAYHLQEAGPLASILTSTDIVGATPPSLGLSLSDKALRLVPIAQNELSRQRLNAVSEDIASLGSVTHEILGQVTNIDARIETLELLAGGTLALNAAGIGLAAASFARVEGHLTRIEGHVEKLGGQIEAVVGRLERIEHEIVISDLDAIRGLAQLFEESWALEDGARSESARRRVFEDGAKLQLAARRRAEAHLGSEFDYALASPHLDVFALISGLRIAALIAGNETTAAKQIEAESTGHLEAMTGRLGLVDLVGQAMSSGVKVGTTQWDHDHSAISGLLRPAVETMRNRERLLATRTSCLELLKQNEVSPRDWLEVARLETEAPILVLASP